MKWAKQDWIDEANCRENDTNDFFDRYDKEFSREEKEHIVDMCRSCPVMIDCHEYAVNTKAWGIHAGKDFRNGKPMHPFYKKKDLWAA